MSTPLLSESVDKVLILRLSRPPSNNLDMELLKALDSALGSFAAEGSARALVISSSCPRYFSAGLDPAEFERRPEGRRAEPLAAILGLFARLRECSKPIVGALTGSALYGGCILALGCDWRIAAADAKLSLAEIRFGLPIPESLLARLHSLCSPPSLVRDLVLRGRALRAEEALGAGLVDQVVDAAQVEAEAIKEAKSLSKLAPAAFGAIKQGLRRASGESLGLSISGSELETLLAGEEAREGLAAMIEKRRPRWE
ncbi:MAG: enoyl-CoA hydratase/isomerase family protein [Elusimicrobia bacterium]|nr:enoyl-CoA hydratase/isomerase family protein [Elusimicrobiota bacterium]